MTSLFKKKKLLQKGYFRFQEAHDPEILIWENMSQSWKSKLMIFSTYFTLACIFIAIGFTTFWESAVYEKLRTEYIKSDCNGLDYYSEKAAYEDFQLPKTQQQGLMHCYCQQMYDMYGDKALKILFQDGITYDEEDAESSDQQE